MSRIAAVILLAAACALAGEVTVKDSAELTAAFAKATPGTTILLAPGTYKGGLYFSGKSGTADARITLRGADLKNPPVFHGGSNGLHFADCNYLTLASFIVRGFPGNGLNCDDGGSFDTPMHHLVIYDVTIEDIGPTGNNDGLKMSGVDQFILRDCRISGWGGSGIDMVGCHKGVVEDCTFFGKPGHENSEAIQMKGGCADNLVQGCFFNQAGDRGLNLGGSTGLQFFRPKVGDFEATRLLVAGNRFYGGQTPVAWPTSNACRVVANTIVLPTKWIGRILQESSDERFKPSHDGVFERNCVVFDKRVGAPEFVNVGRGTAPETWKFTGNAWFDTDGARKPKLPGTEEGSVYQVDPKIVDAGKATMRMTSEDERLKNVGARAWRKLDAEAWLEGKQRPAIIYH